jgi:hypothetical protein
MKLSVISERDNRRTRVYNFDYPDKTKWGKTHDQRPRALFLGGWWHPNTGNRLVGAVNLNYLSDAQIDRIRRSLPDIFGKKGNLKSRARAVRALIPDIFDTAYRTYDIKNAGNVTLDTVHFIPPEEADKRLDPMAAVRPESGTTPPVPEVPEVPAAEVPEIPEVPEVPEATAEPEAPEQPGVESERPDLAAPEVPDRAPSGAGETAAPEIPGAPGFKPTSRQRRTTRPDVEDDVPAMASPSTPSIKVKTDGRPKPTSYQRRKGILGRIKDKVTGWGSALGNFLSKWRKRDRG